MKKLLGPIMMLISGLLLSSSILKAESESLKRAKVFLKKKQACHVAITPSSPEDESLRNSVFCVWDGTANIGTINEFSGCFSGWYNMVKDKYFPLVDVGAGLMHKDQPKGKCSKKIVTDILIKYPMQGWHESAFGQKPVLPSMLGTVIYDRWNIVTPSILKMAKDYKEQFAFDLKPLTPEECSDHLTLTQIYQCSSPKELLYALCGFEYPDPVFNKDQEWIKAISTYLYKQKTGRDVPPCSQVVFKKVKIDTSLMFHPRFAAQQCHSSTPSMEQADEKFKIRILQCSDLEKIIQTYCDPATSEYDKAVLELIHKQKTGGKELVCT